MIVDVDLTLVEQLNDGTAEQLTSGGAVCVVVPTLRVHDGNVVYAIFRSRRLVIPLRSTLIDWVVTYSATNATIHSKQRR